jgi:hypothetical protein
MVLLAALIGSGWRHIGWQNSRGSHTGLEEGALCIGATGPFASADSFDRWFIAERPFSLRWLPDWSFGWPGWYVIVPLWIPLVMILAFTVAAWRLDAAARRRASADLCMKCGYDRSGLAPDGACPECGAGP